MCLSVAGAKHDNNADNAVIDIIASSSSANFVILLYSENYSAIGE
ncbi:MAG: hypothetical protein R1F54_11115 [Candidatus Zeuxoniibacter abyssi]|nr:MAG: hypothetical protein R1F54_11115 [Candidatus Persebacteraceae bacterium AB1(2)]